MTLVICVAAVVTSAISGTFGMAGGLILLGVYLWLLPVADAMLLHGITQLGANGSRCYILREHIDRAVVVRYGAGAITSLLLFSVIAVSLPKPIVYLLLGAIPIVSSHAPRGLRLSIARPLHAVICGAIVTVCHLTAGAAGAILDLFFLDERLGRHRVVATKACTQCVGHLCKILYFGAVVPAVASPAGLKAWVYPVLFASVLTGTFAGSRLLFRMTDARFQKWSRAFVLAISLLYLAQGVRLQWFAGA